MKYYYCPVCSTVVIQAVDGEWYCRNWLCTWHSDNPPQIIDLQAAE